MVRHGVETDTVPRQQRDELPRGQMPSHSTACSHGRSAVLRASQACGKGQQKGKTIQMTLATAAQFEAQEAGT
jgi:hypothetical protein